MISFFLSLLFMAFGLHQSTMTIQSEMNHTFIQDTAPASTKNRMAHILDTAVMPALIMVPLTLKLACERHVNSTIKHVCLFFSAASSVVGIECGCQSVCHALYESEYAEHHNDSASIYHNKMKKRLAQYALLGSCGGVLFGIASYLA